MTGLHKKVDPGLGDQHAPPGTEARAKFVLLRMHGLVPDLPKTPSRFVGWWTEITARYPIEGKPGKTLAGWQLLHDDVGGKFKTLDAFCEFRVPWGLGMARKDIVAFLKAAHVIHKPVAGVKLELDADRVAKLAAAKDGRQDRTRAGNGTFDHSNQSDKNGVNIDDVRHRAIARAPEPVPDLYAADLIDKGLAASLGPDRATDEQRATVEAAAAVARDVLVARGAPRTDGERAETKKAVNEAVKAVRAPVSAPAAKAPDAVTEDIVNAWVDRLAPIAPSVLERVAIRILTALPDARARVLEGIGL